MEQVLTHCRFRQRERLIEDMSLHALRRKRGCYIRIVSRFVAFLGRSPDTATPEDTRRW